MHPIRGKTFVVLTLMLTACSGTPPDLPPIPEIDTTVVLPAVRAQMETARTALEQKPLDAGRNADFAMVLHAYDRSEAAFALYDRARRLAPRDPRWPYYQSAVLQRLGQLEQSLAALDDALGLAEDHIDVMAKRGEALFLLGRLDEAELQFDEVVQKNPSYPLAQFYLARLHMERQEWDKAVIKFEDLLSRGLNVRDLHQNLGVALRMLGRTGDAEKHLAIAARQEGLVIKSFDPINMVIAELNVGDQPHLARAGELYAHGKLDLAIQELETALEKNPDSLGAHLHLIRFFAEQANVDAARTHYDAVMKIEPTNATAHTSWALALSQSGQHELALQAYRKAIAADPGEASVRVAIAGVLGRLGRLDEAMEALDEVEKLAPGNRNALYLRGTTLIALGRHREALVPLEQVRGWEDRNTPMVLRGMAVAHHALGEMDAAKEHLDAAIAVARRHNNLQVVRFLEGEQRKLTAETAQ